jgi:hypothetical protein
MGVKLGLLTLRDETYDESVQEQGVEEDIWSYEG